MGLTLFQSPSQYSLIIKDHIIRLVELKKPTPNGVREFFEHPIPSGVIENGQLIDHAKLEAILRDCVKEWKLKGKKLNTVVPNALAVVRKLDLPGELNQNEIRSYLFMEIGQSIHLPFENPVFDTYLIRQQDDRTELLLFAAPEDVVKSYVDLLEACGTKPVAAEISPLSLYRLYQSLDLVKEDNIMFVQFDEDGINVSIFNGEIPLFIRQVSSESIDTQLDQTGSRYAEVFSEIERIMSFYQFTIHNGLNAVQKIAVTGDHPDLQAFTSQLASAIPVPVYPLFEEKVHGLADQPIPPAFYVNIGLALKEAVRK